MKKVFVLILALLCFDSFGQSDKNAILIKETIEKYTLYKSISYDIDYMIKTFDEQDPFYINSKVDIIKSETDTIFKGSFVYSRKDKYLNVIKYYKSQELYIIDLDEKLITCFDASKQQIHPVTGNFDGGVLQTYFLDINRLQKKMNNVKNKLSFLENEDYLQIKISYPDSEDFYDGEESVYIEKKTKLITKICYQVKYEDQIQKNHWVIKNIVFDQVDDFLLSERILSYFETFETEKYKPRTEDDNALLTDGLMAPKMKGNVFPNYKKEIELNFDKITILDFWYTACMPCIKTIPHLNKLKKKYKDEIEIIGVNDIEYQEKNKGKIDDFLKRTPINYPIFLVKEVPKNYNIWAYPTLYILDKEGVVRFSKVGISENTYNELNDILSELITE